MSKSRSASQTKEVFGYLFGTGLFVCACGLGYYLWSECEKAQQELLLQEKKYAEKVAEKNEVQRIYDNKKQYLERVGNDPEFLQNEVRQRLGYAESGEYIIKVEPSRSAK